MKTQIANAMSTDRSLVQRAAVQTNNPFLPEAVTTVIDVKVTVLGSFIPRGNKLSLNGVEMEVPAGVRIPFIVHPLENPDHIPMALCFADGDWWPITPDAFSEVLGIPQEELHQIIWQFGQDPFAQTAEERMALQQRFKQRNPPAELKESHLV